VPSSANVIVLTAVRESDRLSARLTSGSARDRKSRSNSRRGPTAGQTFSAVSVLANCVSLFLSLPVSRRTRRSPIADALAGENRNSRLTRIRESREIRLAGFIASQFRRRQRTHNRLGSRSRLGNRLIKIAGRLADLPLA